jgi:DNA-binding transcriptional MocR family regulator
MVKQYQISGRNASAIADSLERAIDDGVFSDETAFPTIRGLAERIGVSPTTVNAAYAQLRARGRIGGNRRGGSQVVKRAAFPTAAAASLRPGVRDLVIANPDPSLLPVVRPFIEKTLREGRLYREDPVSPKLLAAARRHFQTDGVDAAHVMVTSGAADAVERALLMHVLPGETVALEDPTYPPYRELCAALNVKTVPLAMDEHGILPSELAKAIRARAKALIVIPRFQNPTGAAFDEHRVRDIAKLTHGAPNLLVIEDDYLGLLGTGPFHSLAGRQLRWLLVRSVTKPLGPDLRTAFVTGDQLSIERLQHRQRLTAGWVSWMLQDAVGALLDDKDIARRLKSSAKIYATRRLGVASALRKRGVEVGDCDGFSLWINVDDEMRVVQELDAQGWAVDAGTRYRFRSRPAIRVVTTTLDANGAQRFAGALVRALSVSTRTTP